MADEPEMKWYGTGRVAEMFGVTTDTVANWIKADLLPAVQINKRWKIKHDDVIKFGRARYGKENEGE